MRMGVENYAQIDEFHIISLLGVEAKIFFSVVSNRQSASLARNTYIDTSVQKVGIARMPAHWCTDAEGPERTRVTCQCCGLTWPMHSAPAHTSLCSSH